MSFVSPEFALLCLLFFPLYWQLVGRPKVQRALMLLSGYGLYATWSLTFAGVLFTYSVGIWALGWWVSRHAKERLPMVLALVLCASFLVLRAHRAPVPTLFERGSALSTLGGTSSCSTA